MSTVQETFDILQHGKPLINTVKELSNKFEKMQVLIAQQQVELDAYRKRINSLEKRLKDVS